MGIRVERNKMKTAIINEKNASKWAEVLEMVKVINSLKSIDDFYGNVLPTWGVEEVYSRLHGWRKEAYKNYIMSGDFVLEDFGDSFPTHVEYWGYGRYNPNASSVEAIIKRYPNPCYDWDDHKDEKTYISWKEVCELYSF